MNFNKEKIVSKYDFIAVGRWSYLLQCHPVALLCKHVAGVVLRAVSSMADVQTSVAVAQRCRGV